MIFLQILGVELGLLYLYLEYKANIWLWLVSMLMPIVHGFLYFQKGLYADAGMNVYYVLAAIYGWIIWLRNDKKTKSNKKSYRIANTPMRLVPWLVAAFVIFDVLITYILINYTNSEVPYADAFTTALAFVAMWMLSRKYVEQWLVWLVVDVVTTCLYIYKGIPITAGLYALYSILAVVGYFRWKKMMIEEKQPMGIE